MTRIDTYVNNSNGNKFLEVHRYSCSHNSVRQYVAWGSNIQPIGDKALHRMRKAHLKDLLKDYRLINIRYKVWG